MNVAVIGASGFLGRTLCRVLLADGHTIYGFGRSGQRPPSASPDVCWSAFDACCDVPVFPADCDAVFYLSQSPHYREFATYGDHVLAVNTLGAVKAATAAAAGHVKFFCYASSGTVYAPSFAPLDENAPVRRDNGYALSKLGAEESLPLVAGDMRHTSVRIFGLYGPGQTGMLVPRLHQRIMNGDPVTLERAPDAALSSLNWGPTTGIRLSLCYVEDAANCLTGLLRHATHTGDAPRVLNLAGPRAVGIRELCETIGEVAGRRPVFHAQPTRRAFDLHADITRLQSLLAPRFTDLKTALRETFGPKHPVPEAA